MSSNMVELEQEPRTMRLRPTAIFVCKNRVLIGNSLCTKSTVAATPKKPWFIFKKHDILRYVTFLYTKTLTLHKKKTICVTFLYTKIRTVCVTQFFMEFLKLAEGGGIFKYNKKSFYVTFLYPKNNALCVTFLNTKSLILSVTFLYPKKKSLYVTFYM